MSETNTSAADRGTTQNQTRATSATRAVEQTTTTKKTSAPTTSKPAGLRAKTPVEKYGQLSVKQGRLVDKNGNPVQLRGISTHGLQWFPQYVNESLFRYLRDEFCVDVIRLAMYTADGGYIDNPNVMTDVMYGVNICLKLGLYVIIDWHILNDNDPLLHMDEAKLFFAEMAEKYAGKPNIIYEICNEPNDGDWGVQGNKKVNWSDNIKPYAEEMIPLIRRYEPNNIIVVGTPSWSSRPDIVLTNPLDTALQKNVMYTFHFYAGSHTMAEFQGLLEACIAHKLPIFVTECGTSDINGKIPVKLPESDAWYDFLDKNGISYVFWCLCPNGGPLNANASFTGNWSTSDLNEQGLYWKARLRAPYEK